LWKADVERSIDYYNDWFIRFANILCSAPTRHMFGITIYLQKGNRRFRLS